VECPDGLGEAPGGDPPVPVGAEELAVDSFLVFLLRLPQLLPDPAPEMIGEGRRFRQQLAREQAPVAVGPKASGQDPLKQSLLLDDPFWTKLAKAKAAAQDALSGRVLPTTAKMRERPARSERPCGLKKRRPRSGRSAHLDHPSGESTLGQAERLVIKSG
jgi:hypothetical protein